MKKALILISAVLILASGIFAQRTTNGDPQAAKFVTSDIDLFWAAYDKAKPENDLIVYRDEYLKKGSPGLQEFTRLRIGTSCNLVNSVAASPKYYAALREPSLKIATYEKQTRASFVKLKEIYPEAVFPDVYFVVGRMSSAGTLSDKGLLIGVDMFGKNEGAPLDELGGWHKAVVSSVDRLPFIVAHELIHYEQKYAADETLLARALGEGIPDFVAELIAGDTINPHLHKYADPLEKELWLEFKREMNGKNVGNWLYQGDQAKDKPADLGYWMGYKIAENYYKNARDKKQAVKDMLEIKDFAKFLADSRYEEKFK
ncbi:MAG TPA: DUF2268 domain-containing putative Zn-dependent protease [Pyrinomonadaceae bacterium]